MKRPVIMFLLIVDSPSPPEGARAAEALVHKAHAVCPYSNATRDNMAVRLVLVSALA